MTFQKAVKTAAKLRMMIAGPSGSGKTFTALRIAKGLAQGKPIAVIDTEHGSASKYADLFNFDVVNLAPPFAPDRFVELIHEAERAGYAVIILDSTSHAWEGEGGVLDIVQDSTVKNKGNSYVAWKDGTPVQNRFTRAMQQSGLHVIATARSKTDYMLVGDGGKQAPKKVGMAPIQRNGFEYEFDVVLELDIEHNGVITKTRAVALDGRTFRKPGEDVAALLLDWLQGAPAPKGKPEGNGNQNGSAPAPVWQAWKAPADAFAWAIEQGACANEFEAKNSLKKIVDQHGGRLNSGNMAEVFAAYHAHQIDKLAAAQPAPAVPDDVNFGMGDQPFDDDAPVPTIHMAEQPALVTGGGKGTY